ncbi:HEAT repeat domain-containing protein [Halobellus sp. EA9]|uniref:HEAT repeat domain-containing protein n=1 Tax=Halobellus sp. EA9 TaxID=3421647 RepID=UPI003EB8D38D
MSARTLAALQVGAVPRWIVVLSALVLLSLLFSTALLTVGYSVLRYLRRRRRDAVREDLRAGLLERLYGGDDPDWEAWVETLSKRERSVTEELLEEYLRELRGSDARALFGLGEALGIPERARADLADGGYYERLGALTWLGLLQDPPSVEALERHCTGTPRERAAAAKVLYLSDYPDLPSTGARLLLRDASEAFTVFGIDTLYRVVESDPGPLFERAAADAHTWPPALLQQVLLVARNVNTVVGDADLSWVVTALSSPDERTRAEAARALGGYGWRPSLRGEVDVGDLGMDPSPAVRASVYRMLGEWGDADAVETLMWLAAMEPESRARVAAAEALVSHRERYGVSPPPAIADAWSWATAHAWFDELATDVSTERRR